jgi:hypothetical protein
MSDERLEVVQAREAAVGRGGRPTTSAASRRARVERSRQRAAAAARGGADSAAEETAPDVDLDEDVVVDDDADATEALVVDDDEAAEVAVVDDDAEATEAAVVDDDDETAEDSVTPGFEAGAYPGSALPDADGNAPEGFEIKGNEQSRLYHTPDGRYYNATKAEVYFDTVDSAAGFSAPCAATTPEADAEPDDPAVDDVDETATDEKDD